MKSLKKRGKKTTEEKRRRLHLQKQSLDQRHALEIYVKMKPTIKEIGSRINS